MSTKVFKVKCEAHSLQLVLWDGLRSSNAENIIKMCRLAVKMLRKSSVQHDMHAAGIPLIVPKYDCVTRWSSTYLMVCTSMFSFQLKFIVYHSFDVNKIMYESSYFYFVYFKLIDVIKCKEAMMHYQENRTFQFILSRWIKIEEIIQILKVFYDMTINLQKVEYSLSDFYGSWLLCELKLKNWIKNRTYKYTNLCEKLALSMNKRKADLISNEAMLCSLFLDPRFKPNLSSDEAVAVKHILCDLWLEFINIKKIPNEEMNNNIIDMNQADTVDEDLLEMFFVEREVEAVDGPQVINAPNIRIDESMPDYWVTRGGFMEILNNYEENTKRLHHSQSVRQFWLQKKTVYPQLYELAIVFLGIPPTQASTERSFSALSFIFDCRRSKLSRSMLENILLMKSNKKTALQIFSDDLKDLEKDA